jgi:mRNA-degrading endonuclease toxin of MazEF toxin-antitoxin module
MADTITFRPDEDAARALAVLTRDGTSVSTAARPASFRPEVRINGSRTRVLVEQTTAVDPGRLGESFGHLTFAELREVDAALRLVKDL